MTEELKQQLMEKANIAYQNAYAPYSNFKVGAAILTEDGDIYTGCNVENISFGLTSCAERNAIFSAIAEKAKIKIKAVAVATESSQGASPCGACRQVIGEFGPDAQIYFTHKGELKSQKFSELLPATFDQIA